MYDIYLDNASTTPVCEECAEIAYSVMKDHARATLDILSDIDGFEDITEWAANHHEKLVERATRVG